MDGSTVSDKTWFKIMFVLKQICPTLIKCLSQHLRGEGLKHEKCSYANKWRIFQTQFFTQNWEWFRSILVKFAPNSVFSHGLNPLSSEPDVEIRADIVIIRQRLQDSTCFQPSEHFVYRFKSTGPWNISNVVWSLSVRKCCACFLNASIWITLHRVLPVSKMRRFRTLNLWT